MKNVQFRIDGIGLAVIAIVGLVGLAWVKREDLKKWFNPASDENLAYQAVSGIVGEENLATAGDYFFGAVDLLNPFNESDDYARKVYGIDAGD